jgi:hypothetical protein
VLSCVTWSRKASRILSRLVLSNAAAICKCAVHSEPMAIMHSHLLVPFLVFLPACIPFGDVLRSFGELSLPVCHYPRARDITLSHSLTTTTSSLSAIHFHRHKLFAMSATRSNLGPLTTRGRNLRRAPCNLHHRNRFYKLFNHPLLGA